ncbi:hypothetical protein [Rhizobium giardinii]|jgi:hypothetical protein|uniref:Uncharacterized protein n=1 Tax=Rhizobium giardinii TaxID=56731 RepID=A0A7W8U6M8_9HYPH|nr:hypothetical protein [Rhizobium giardinii]MBB5533819.1 hypothetical protein [Rhizobium giardinii]
MTAREVLLVLTAAFFVLALLLIYNAYYNPVSTSGVVPPATVEPQ